MIGPDLHRAAGAPPRIYGHRGARGVLPENTMSGFEYLRAEGITAVELDVQNAAGGVPVVIHDPLVPAAMARDGTGAWLPAPGPRIIDLTVEQLRAYDLGRINPASELARRFPRQTPRDGARAPSLAQVLEWGSQHRDLLINIEIKSYAQRADLGDPPDILAASVLEQVCARGMDDQVAISSFDWRVLQACRRQAPGVALGYLSLQQPGPHCTIFEDSPWMGGLPLPAPGGSLPGLIADQGAQAWCPYYLDLAGAELEDAHRRGLAVLVWTVNARDEIARLSELGVDGIITDYPADARDVVAGMEAEHPRSE